jgi:hypothetical protein
MILTDSWRITRLCKIHHVGRFNASVHSIHSFGQVKRSTIFYWFPIYFTSWICYPVTVFFSPPRLPVTLEGVNFGYLNARTKWGAELECHADTKVSEVLHQPTELLESLCSVMAIFSYIYRAQIIFRCLSWRTCLTTPVSYPDLRLLELIPVWAYPFVVCPFETSEPIHHPGLRYTRNTLDGIH